jgi:hypothetical protein
MNMRFLPVENRWCVHGYYTLCPFAPDGSGRILASGADLDTGLGCVYIMDSDGKILDRFGEHPVHESFWHTGFWQSWSPDARCVYFQSGDMLHPQVIRRELESGKEVSVSGDMEGLPPYGEPGLSCAHGMLYAAGYSSGKYEPEKSPIPFQQRDRHGISQIDFASGRSTLLASTRQILELHPNCARLKEADEEIRRRLGQDEGLTLMTYCVRWNPQGDRFLFYFGNHCVVPERGEPKVASIFTANRDLSEIHLAVDLSFGKRGVHWGWHPDGEQVLGYGPDPDGDGLCIAAVRYDGTGYRKLCSHSSGGHPSVCPTDHNLLVTDTCNVPGSVDFVDLKQDRIIERVSPGRVYGEKIPPGRNPFRVCHHPVFSPDGKRVLCNAMTGRHAALCEITR